MEQRLASERFDAVVHLGVAVRTRVYRLEAVAKNRVDSTLVDAVGEAWHCAEVDPGGLPALEASLPAAQAYEHLVRHGFSVELSHDAGAYVCNFLYYLSLRRALDRQPPTPTVFLHLPGCADEGPDRAAEAVLNLLDLAAGGCARPGAG